MYVNGCTPTTSVVPKNNTVAISNSKSAKVDVLIRVISLIIR